MFPGPTGAWTLPPSLRTKSQKDALDRLVAKSSQGAFLVTEAQRKQCVTCKVVVNALGAIVHVQLIFKGQDADKLFPRQSEVHPKMSLFATNSKWSTTESMLDVLKRLEAYRVDYLKNNRSSLSKQFREYKALPLILYLDCAPVHTSERLRKLAQKHFPSVWITFIPPRATGFLQPLDIAFFGAFKAALKRSYITDLCNVIVNQGKVTNTGG
jgi:hypothetical protein